MANNNKPRISGAKLWTRILCGILAALMVGSVAYLAIQLISESIIEEKEKAENTTTKAPTTTKTPTTTKAPSSTTTKAPTSSAAPSDNSSVTTEEPTDNVTTAP